ncbi:MAG: short-chain dehydrogenase/reductase SDR [Deltaproteobacteria bacterium]|nr:MAG: short-chain dehydrogenase/reductase SDR [Deltaproteobacteria bacterium]
MFKGKGPSGFGYGSTAESVTEGLDLSGRTILLTGSNSGIGKETLRVLTKRGAHVIAAARTVEKAQTACDEVGGETTAVACELSDPASVQACAERVIALGQQLDAIICNAGIMALPTLNQKLGYELQFFTNHIGHFILVTSLLDSLAEKGRVVMVSSDAHNGAPKEGIQFDNLSGEREYGAWANYGQSKLANLLFASHLAKRLEGTGKTANSLHPGVIHTNLARSMNPIARGALAIGAPLVLKSVGEGAATQVYLAVHPSVEDVAGKYFSDCNVGKSSSHGRDEEMAAKLWEVSEKIAVEVTA